MIGVCTSRVRVSSPSMITTMCHGPGAKVLVLWVLWGSVGLVHQYPTKPHKPWQLVLPVSVAHAVSHTQHTIVV